MRDHAGEQIDDGSAGPAAAADAISARLITVTLGESATQKVWSRTTTYTWPDLAALLTSHQVGAKDGPCIVPAHLDGPTRGNRHAQRIGVVMLDSDSGASLSEIQAAATAHGWTAAIASTHSHLGRLTKAKRGAFEAWCRKQGLQPAATDAPQRFLIEERRMRPDIAAAANIAAQDDVHVTFMHQPCPRFRIALPLARPWVAEAYDTSAAAVVAWQAAYEALASALNLQHDRSCADPARLFYLPRYPADGPPPETVILDGELCDIFALPPVPIPAKPERRRRQARATPANGAQPQASHAASGLGLDFGDITFPDPDAGEIFNLTRWAASSSRHFEIVNALKARSPQTLLGLVTDGTKHHVRCPNEGAHTQAGTDHATFIANASQSTSSGFVIHCRHAHCTDRDRLLFLHQMLEQGWLTIGDLQNPQFLPGQPAEPPLIRMAGGKIPEIIQRAEDALLVEPYRLYQRGSLLVRPGLLRLGPQDDPSHSALRIVPIESYALAELLSQVARWEHFDARSEEWRRIDAPLKVATTLMQRSGLWRLPVLSGIISAPTLRPDGSLLQAPGYDHVTGLILDPQGVSYPPIPDCASQDAARTALTVLNGLIGTFPFVSQASRSVALSAILTAISAARIETPSSSSCDSVWARRVIRSSRAATSTAPSWRHFSSAAWNQGRRSSLPLATSLYSAIRVQPWLATKALTLACCASSPSPLCPCSAVETR